MFKKTVLLLSLSSAIISCGVANAEDTVSKDMQVTLTVLKACTLSTNPLKFANAYSNAGAQEANTTATVTCTKDTGYYLTASSANSYNMMGSTAVGSTGKSTSSSIAYTLAATMDGDTTRQDLTTASTDVASTGTGSAQTVTLYGDVTASALQNAPAGDYSDTVTLTVNY